MKLIAQYPDLMSAQDASLRLRQQGILTHISSRNSFVASGFLTGAFTVGLWAVLDHQYHDACSYLVDPSHHIASGLAEQEILKLEQHASKHSFNFFNKLIGSFAIILIAIVGSLIVIANKA